MDDKRRGKKKKLHMSARRKKVGRKPANKKKVENKSFRVNSGESNDHFDKEIITDPLSGQDNLNQGRVLKEIFAKNASSSNEEEIDPDKSQDNISTDGSSEYKQCTEKENLQDNELLTVSEGRRKLKVDNKRFRVNSGESNDHFDKEIITDLLSGQDNLNQGRVMKEIFPKNASSSITNEEEINPDKSQDNINTDRSSEYNLCMEKENLQDNELFTVLEGRRIVDIQYFIDGFLNFPHEFSSCESKYLKYIKEIRIGFITKLLYKCSFCCKEHYILTEDPAHPTNVNRSIVEGFICTGNGFSQLEEISACLNMPCMNTNKFYKEQEFLNDKMEELAYEQMLEAGKEEKRIAIEKNMVDDDGIPYIPVVADGSWAKRSYKANFSSLSGAAVIVGYETRKVLFLGVRNTYCCICHRASKIAAEKNEPLKLPEHHCYKNWTGSATAMETDIIAEGFKSSIDMHGLRFKTLIGDGDSSVTKKLAVSRPYGNEHSIRKIECKNHLLRNFSNKLRSLGKKTHNKKGAVPVTLRKKVESSEPRFRTAIKGASEFRKHQEGISFEEKIRLLKIDFRNIPYHIFGHHNNCASYFCQRKYKPEQNCVPELQDCGIWDDISRFIGDLTEKADSILLDMTNNSAELFNSIIAKFVGGKRVCFVSRGSYQGRCFGAVTSFNADSIHDHLQKKISGENSGLYTEKFVTKRLKGKENVRKKRKLSKDNASVKKKKVKVAKSDENYGLQEIEDDMPKESLAQKCTEFLETLKKTSTDIENLQKATIEQSVCNQWLVERRKRLTASVFGKICKMRSKTSASATLKELLYKTFKGNSATDYGKEHEDRAIHDFEILQGIKVKRCGFFVDPIDGYLGASPDGLIGNDGIIEVKCPYVASKTSARKAIEDGIITYCKITSQGLELKTDHNYYYQIQGQLHVTGRKYCYFILWTPSGMLLQKICRDDAFFEDKMKDPLKIFYMQCLLPELIDPRIPRNMPVRERNFINN